MSLDVPLLAVRVGEQLELFDETCFADHEWDLAACDPSLPGAELALTTSDAERGEIDVDVTGRVQFVRDLHEQLNLLAMSAPDYSPRWPYEGSLQLRKHLFPVVGELWAERSNGGCFFVMPQGPDWAAISTTIRG